MLALCVLSACGANKHAPPVLGDEDSPSGGSGGAGASAGGGNGGGAGSGAQGGNAGTLGTSGASAGGAAGAEGELGCIAREQCRSYCSAFGVDSSVCGLGSPSQCGCTCEQRFNQPCPLELAALLSCAGSTPNVDCATRGRIIAGCEQQSFDLELCDFRGRERLCAQDAPRCLDFCKAAVLSYCPLAPDSLSSCLCGCEASLVARCGTQFDAFMACTADAPAFSCAPDGRNVATSCQTEWQALDTCVRGASPPDAGN